MIKNINKILNSIYQNKKFVLSIFLVVLIGVFFISNNVNAGVGPVGALGKGIATMLTWILHGIVFALGHLLVVIMWILVPVASYSDFVRSAPVTMGWAIVRDFCNMFFILILLLIAFATILRVETYNIKKALPKLLIMAVLINFSKTICGVFIDFSQIIMLTFVNSFKEAAGGNITNMLGIADLLRLSYTEYGESAKINTYSILGSYIFALIYLLISIVVMTVLIFVLIYRIVMLWIYIVLSPIAYLTAAFPQGARISSQWWGEFSKNLVVGPMLAFFIWLSFASLGNIDGKTILADKEDQEMFDFQNAPQGIPTKAGSADHMIKFAISIGMLMGGLMVTQQMGGAFGNMASKGMGAIQKGRAMALSPFKKAGTVALDTVRDKAKGVRASVASGALKIVGGGLQKTKIDSLQKLGKVSSGLGKDIKTTRRKEREENRLKTLKSFGFREDSDSMKSLGEFADTKLARHAKTGLATAGAITLGATTGGATMLASGLAVAGGIGGRTMLSEHGRKKQKEKEEKNKKITEKSEKERDYNIEKETDVAKTREAVAETKRASDLTSFEASHGANAAQGAFHGLSTEQWNVKHKALVDDPYDYEMKKIKEDTETTKKVEEEKHIDRIHGVGGTEKGQREKLRNTDIEKIEVDVKAEVARIKTLGLSPTDEMKQVNDSRAKGKGQMDDVQGKYDKDIKKMGKPFQSSLMNSLADYHPNKVTKDAVKKGMENYENAKKRVGALAGGEDITRFDKSTFYSPSGFNKGQDKFFERLCSSEEGTEEALAKMATSFKKIKELQSTTGSYNGDGQIVAGQLASIEAMKKGIAAFSKKGGNTGKLSEVISALNGIATNKDSGAKSVEEYKESVIINK